MKKIITLLLISTMMFSLTSCFWIEQLSWDKSKQFAVDVADLDGDGIKNDALIYQNSYYYLDPRVDFRGNYEELELISWNGLRFIIFYVHFFYSYTEDNPDWICNYTWVNGVCLREGYDYKSSDFIINGTDTVVNYADIFDDNSNVEYLDNVNRNVTTIYLEFENHKDLYLILDLYFENEEWYGIYTLSLSSCEKIKLSDEFISILIENGIIE